MRRTKSRTNKLKWAELSKEVRLEKPMCEYCNKVESTQVHHIISKFYAKSRWRYDKRNLACCCSKCHFIFHKNPVSTMTWFMKQRPMDYKYLIEDLELLNMRYY